MKPAALILSVFLIVSPLLALCGGIAEQASGESLPSWSRVFHLHDGDVWSAADYDWMNSTGPANPSYTDYDGDGLPGITIRKNVPPQRWHHWVLYPEVNSDVVLTGDISAYVWAKSRDNESGSIVTAIFFDMAPGDLLDPGAWTEIGQVDVPMTGPIYSEFRLYNLTLTGVSYTLPQSHFLVLTVQRGDMLNDGLVVWYDKTDYDSYLVLTTTTFISVDSMWTEDASGAPRDTFSDMEQVVLFANVSNPFGAYEILDSEVSVRYSSNGTGVVSGLPMTMDVLDPSGVPRWKLFQVSLPQLSNGSYLVTAYARDPQGTPAWLECSLTIVGVDHFGVDAPSTIVAGEAFSMTITAFDANDQVLPNWIGTVLLDAYKSDMMTPGEGSLSITVVNFDFADAGQVVVPNQQYDYGEEVIAIEACSGARTGWSSAITVLSGPVAVIEIDPSDDISMEAGDPRSFSVTGKDANNNTNTSWTPYWQVIGGIGDLTTNMFFADFQAIGAGTGLINCSDPVTGVSVVVQITVVPGPLDNIQITPTGPLTVPEGETRSLSAYGYDVYGNLVDLTGAMWLTTTSGTIVGTGSSATYKAGFIPETGMIYAEKDGKQGSVVVYVINAESGPWLSEIPPQIGTEDNGWSLSLSTYWHHENGTDGLEWYTVGVDQSLYIITRDTTFNSIVNFVPQPDKSGDDVFELWVRDPLNYFSTYQNITVSIQPVNDKPKFVNHPPATIYVRFNTPYTFDYSYYVMDVDTPKSELTLSSSLVNAHFDGLVATFTFEGEGGKSYFEIVKLTLSDGMASTEMNVVVWVTDDHPPSLITPIDDVVIYEGDMNVFVCDLDDYFFDLDNEYLVYAEDFENIEVYIDQITHGVFMSAPTEWSGTTEGTFTAVDPRSAFKIDTVRVTVIPVNDAPIVISPGTVFVRYDDTAYVNLKAYVEDPDNAYVELSVTFTDSHISLTSPFDFRMVLLFPANLSGAVYTEPYRITVGMNVSDPENYTYREFSVLVSDNYPPVLRDPNRQSFYSFLEDGYLNDTLRFGDLFYDADSDSILNYSILSASAGGILDWTIYPDGVVNLTAAPDRFGTEVITLRATDEHDAWASWMATIYVVPINDPPVIMQIPDKIVKNGPRSMQYNISQYIIDVETYDLSDFIFRIEPSVNVILVGDALFITLPDKMDIITVKMSVSDGESDSNEVEFRVGVKKTIGAIIGWPYSLPFMLLAAAVGGYFIWTRIPRPFELENLFLIHNDGRLISHVARAENTNLDQDVVSAMFTAVQEFVRDSFQKGEVGLKKLEIGDKSVVIEKGRSAYVALIYSGHPPEEVLDSLAVVLRDVEERYKGRIERWNGTLKSLKGVEKMLTKYMSVAYKPGDWQEEEEIGEEEWVDILSKEA